VSIKCCFSLTLSLYSVGLLDYNLGNRFASSAIYFIQVSVLGLADTRQDAGDITSFLRHMNVLFKTSQRVDIRAILRGTSAADGIYTYIAELTICT
jgi:hypothetical protein